LNDARDIRAALEHAVDLVLDSGSCGIVPTTVVDLTGETPMITRQGRGSAAALGLAA
jgi:tRNA A37 threonylcarbamoyladenosine synthetase subunit TsaC/SUA5/YrdC